MEKTAAKKFIPNIIIIIVITIIFLTMGNKAISQDFTAAKAFEDYQYQESEYKQSKSDYNEAKTFYLKNPTLQLKEDARQKTLKMLKNRDELTSTYLTLLRMQIYQGSGFTNEEKNTIFAKIDPEIAWYQNHKESYKDGDELATLFTKSDEAKNRWSNDSTAIVYECLFDVSLGQTTELRMRHGAIYSNLTNYINDKVSQGKLKIDPFNRWLNDTDVVLKTLQENELLAKEKIQSINGQTYGVSHGYESAIEILTASVSPLSQLNNYLTEMLTTIKNLEQ